MMHEVKEGSDVINLYLWSFFWVSATGYGVETQKDYPTLKGRFQVPG
jgi:hypothetical protein